MIDNCSFNNFSFNVILFSVMSIVVKCEANEIFLETSDVTRKSGFTLLISPIIVIITVSVI